MSAGPAYSLAVFTYMFNVGSVGFWLPLYARGLSFSYTEVTGLAAVYFTVLLAAVPAAGVLADVTGKPRGFTVAGMALLGAASVELAHATSFPALAALRGLQALGSAMAFPVSVGALTRIFGVGEGVKLSAALQGAGMAFGAFVAGVLYEHAGWPAVAYSYAALALATAAVVAASEPPPRAPRPVGVRGVLEALRKAPLGVKAVLAVLVARNTFATGAFSVLSIIFSRMVGLPTLLTGVALAVNPAVQALSAGPSSRIARRREVTAYSLGIALTGVTMYLYSAASGVADAVAAQALQGFSYALINVSANRYIISRMPAEARYTAASLFPLAFNGGWITGNLIAGPFMDALGVRAWLHVAGAGCLLLGLTSLAALRAVEARARLPVKHQPWRAEPCGS